VRQSLRSIFLYLKNHIGPPPSLLRHGADADGVILASGPTVPRTLCELHSGLFCWRRRPAIVFIVSPPLCCVMTGPVRVGKKWSLEILNSWSVFSHHSRGEDFAQAADDQGSSDWPCWWSLKVIGRTALSWQLSVQCLHSSGVSILCVHYRDDLFSMHPFLLRYVLLLDEWCYKKQLLEPSHTKKDLNHGCRSGSELIWVVASRSGSSCKYFTLIEENIFHL
jgi:hypothetical protein